ncbi:MAG: CRISPR system precrRNA processing endoribonuclease RAMP protein Cas6 [Ardenticatenaceae bacterium]|nr:CRISPR system precrRNA processing endoribonuclease RAMP protein Cas6 [Ardenticatenaceae bacterium]
MHTITYLFEPLDEPLNGRYIHAKGLHGFLFNITGQADRQESDWLHHHETPRPFTLVPLYGDDSCLAGIRLSTLTDRATSLFQRTGEWFSKTERPCHLGGHEFIIRESRTTPSISWQQLALSEPTRQIGLRFLSPCGFKQGPRVMPLPLPANVFGSPIRVWEAFAPPMMVIPPDWRDWCAQNVFVTQHNIETVQINISQRERFTGFVGEVWFEAHQGDEYHLRTWQALSTLATFCGVGYKTTMGMGAVERMS